MAPCVSTTAVAEKRQTSNGNRHDQKLTLDGSREAFQKPTAKRDTLLVVLYGITTYLCVAMVVWILIAPASWLIGRSRFHREVLIPFLKNQEGSRLVPTVILTKYVEHPAVHFTHLLPGALWAGIIPFQLHPTWRQSHRRLHRLSGYVFLFAATAMTVGIGIIVQRKLTFVHGFPDLTPTDHGFSPNQQMCTIIFLGLWFIITIVQAVRMARARQFDLHQKWVIRHVASGIWIAVQRFVMLPFFTAFESQTYPPPEPIPSWVQRQRFADSSVYAGVICIVIGELVINRLAHLKTRTRMTKKLE